MALITIIIIIVTSKKLSTQEKPQDFNFQLGERNIIIFSFDGIPGITMNEFTSDPKFLDTFKDFILHKNTISHSPATYASTYHELFGAMDWKSVASTQLQLEKLSNEFMNSEQIWYLENAIRYGAYSEFGNQANKKLLIQNGAILLGKRNSLLAFVSVPIISSSFCKFGFCTLGEKYGNLANYIRKISLTTGNLSDRMRRSSNDYKAFEKIINSISKDNKVFGSFFGHFTFTHAPILQNENCVFLSSSLNQNEQLVRKQVMCVISLMNKIIYTLKENNLYEESLIVFKSDHGKPNTYFNKNNVRGKKIFNYDNPWGYDRYRPFVMYKNPNQKNKTLVQNEDLFYLSNLSQMYCKFYEFYNDLNIRNCSSIENFMKKNYPSIKTSKDLLYVPESSKTFMYDGHSVFHNKNSIHEMEKMFNSWSIENK